MRATEDGVTARDTEVQVTSRLLYLSFMPIHYYMSWNVRDEDCAIDILVLYDP